MKLSLSQGLLCAQRNQKKVKNYLFSPSKQQFRWKQWFFTTTFLISPTAFRWVHRRSFRQLITIPAWPFQHFNTCFPQKIRHSQTFQLSESTLFCSLSLVPHPPANFHFYILCTHPRKLEFFCWPEIVLLASNLFCWPETCSVGQKLVLLARNLLYWQETCSVGQKPVLLAGNLFYWPETCSVGQKPVVATVEISIIWSRAP